MQSPARKKQIGRRACGSSGQSERFAGRFLAHLPDESVVIKMQQTGRSHYSGQHALDRLDLKAGIEIGERAVGENEPDVEPDQGTAAPENKPHESADAAVFFNPVAVINPDERKILHM